MRRVPTRVRSVGQKSLWTLTTEPPSIDSSQPVAQAIVDSLLTLCASPQERPADPRLALQYSCNLRLPRYHVQVHEPYAARVFDSFNADKPKNDAACGLNIVKAIHEKELGDLAPGPCAPFSLGSNIQLTLTPAAAGESYWAQMVIALCHPGETVINNTAFVVIDPDLSISFRPNPYYRSEDSFRVVLDELLDAFRREVEKRCKQLERSFIPDAFPGGEGRVPNNQVISAGLLAMNSGGHRARALSRGWSADDSGRPTYKYEPTRGKRVLVYPSLREATSNEMTRTEVLWNYVERLEPDLSDVALAVLAQMCEPNAGDRPKHPMLMPVIITDDAILEYKGIDHANRGSERSRIHSQMESLRALSFDVDFSRTEPSGHVSRGLSWQGDRLFDIVRMEQFQEDLFGGRKTVSTTWAVRAGLWAGWWFSTETRLYMGRMARVLLSLGSRGMRRMAKRIGQRLLLLSQVSTPRGEVSIFIRTLLEDVGELLSPEARTRHWASRTRTALEEAIALLEEVGVLKTVQWSEGFGPGDIDREKGWVDPWLNAMIRVRTSISARAGSDFLRDRRFQKPKAMRRNASEVTGSEIRSARNNIIPHWSQEALAHHLAITRSYLSQIETGKRRPRASLSCKLRTWINSRKETRMDTLLTDLDSQSDLGEGW